MYRLPISYTCRQYYVLAAHIIHLLSILCTACQYHTPAVNIMYRMPILTPDAVNIMYWMPISYTYCQYYVTDTYFNTCCQYYVPDTYLNTCCQYYVPAPNFNTCCQFYAHVNYARTEKYLI